ncbi:MAG: hypothetical protein H6709_10205 [Kofleriaceae bacterium]|nr:hypothetical protein [Kofleriaceae bacterium]
MTYRDDTEALRARLTVLESQEAENLVLRRQVARLVAENAALRAQLASVRPPGQTVTGAPTPAAAPGPAFAPPAVPGPAFAPPAPPMPWPPPPGTSAKEPPIEHATGRIDAAPIRAFLAEVLGEDPRAYRLAVHGRDPVTGDLIVEAVHDGDLLPPAAATIALTSTARRSRTLRVAPTTGRVRYAERWRG